MGKILITGINGISGYHLSNRLSRSEHNAVVGTYFQENPLIPLSLFGDIQLIRSNILDETHLAEILKRVQPSQIYHFAAIVPIMVVSSNVWKAYETNVRGTLNLLSAALDVGLDCRILLPGSSDEYGPVPPEELPIRERNRFNPINFYGVSKVAQELTARQFLHHPGLEIVFTRTFNFMGPFQPEQYFTASIAKQIVEAARTGAGTIKVGNADIRRDFLDIRDVASAYEAIMKAGAPGEAYNICSGKGLLLSDIIAKLLELSSTGSVTVETDPAKVRKVDNPLLMGDNQKLKELGWKRAYSIDDTLRDVLEFWEGQ